MALTCPGGICRAVLAGGAALASLAIAAPASAQLAGAINADRDAFEGDYVIVGVGIMSAPDYEGANSGSITPAAGATGELDGISFSLRGPSLSLDLIPNTPGQDVRLRFGPQIRLRTNRAGTVSDPVVARLGKLDNVVEGGFRIGVGFDDVLSRSDSLSVGVSMRWDISGKGSGLVTTPSATYLLPVSEAQAFGFLASIQFVDDRYARYNFSVSPEGAAASGLPVFNAKGGLQEAGVGFGTARDLSGSFLDGGMSIGAGVLYSRLFGSAADSPITSIRGSRDQWTVGAGGGFIF